MAIHYIKSSDAKLALCGRKNPASAVIAGWDGVTCKNCLKYKIQKEQERN